MELLRRMHTAEHLLSAVMRLHFGAPRNLEFHLGEKKTKCDYAPEREISENDIQYITERVNAEIARDHHVSEEFIPRAEAGALDLWKVPPEAETIRVVRLGDFDAQPCSGSHVNHTSEIGRFVILSHEKRQNGMVRIRFKVE